MTPEQLAARVLADVPRYNCTEAGNMEEDNLGGSWYHDSDVLAALARHLAPGDDLVAQATAALEGVTDGPWEESLVATGWEVDGGVNFCYPVSRGGKFENARFIAFARQWVPEAAARIAALTATVGEAERERDRVADINRNLCNSHNTLLVDGSNWQRHAEAAEREAATLRDRLARMEGALTKAANRLDWAAGIIESDNARDQVGGWADETRAALTDGGSNG